MTLLNIGGATRIYFMLIKTSSWAIKTYWALNREARLRHHHAHGTGRCAIIYSVNNYHLVIFGRMYIIVQSGVLTRTVFTLFCFQLREMTSTAAEPGGRGALAPQNSQHTKSVLFFLSKMCPFLRLCWAKGHLSSPFLYREDTKCPKGSLYAKIPVNALRDGGTG